MTTKTASTVPATTARGAGIALPAMLLAAIGLVTIIVTGHVQAGTLHDAAHDVRHATGFPCH